MNKSLILTAVVALAAVAGLTTSHLVAQTRPATTQPSGTVDGVAFNFADPKGVNGIAIFVDSPLEPFHGLAGGVTGTVTYNPDNPAAIAGSISVPTDGIKMVNDRMAQVLFGDDWLGKDANPQITFAFAGAGNPVKQADGRVAVKVQGKLSIAGVTLHKAVDLHVHHIRDGAKARGGAKGGDLLVLRSNFEVSRADFGIKPDMDGKSVGTTVSLGVAIAGYSK